MRTSCIDLAGALFLSACLLVVSGLPGVAVGAAAYDPLGAAVKADQYWNSTNYPSPYGPNGGTDCTNYAAIMMHLGGNYPFRTSKSGDYNWYFYSWSRLTSSWITAANLERFLIYDWPGGWQYAHVSAASPSAYSSVYQGDLIFFAWDGSHITHVAMQVGTGGWYEDQDSQSPGAYHVGDYIDQHTINRHHQAWNGYYENRQAATTWVWEIHIDLTN